MPFKLTIGAKRQVTLPSAFMEMLSLEEGGELLLEAAGDHATLTPIVSIPRTDLSEELRVRFGSRRGSKASDIPLADLLLELKGNAKAESGKVASPNRVKTAAQADEVQEAAVFRKVQQRETM